METYLLVNTTARIAHGPFETVAEAHDAARRFIEHGEEWTIGTTTAQSGHARVIDTGIGPPPTDAQPANGH